MVMSDVVNVNNIISENKALKAEILALNDVISRLKKQSKRSAIVEALLIKYNDQFSLEDICFLLDVSDRKKGNILKYFRGKGLLGERGSGNYNRPILEGEAYFTVEGRKIYLNRKGFLQFFYDLFFLKQVGKL
jgi:hypothetical protein